MISLYKIFTIQKFNNHFKIQLRKKDQIVFLNFSSKIQLLKSIKKIK